MTTFNLDKINFILNELKNLPKLKEVRELKLRLTKEKEKLTKVTPAPAPAPNTEQRKIAANIRRSNLMKKKWNYIKLIYDSYPIFREQFSIKQVWPNML